MAGNFIKTKTYNRHFAINIGTKDNPQVMELARGVTSRGNSVTENTAEFFDMASRGTPETDIKGQTIVRNFSGVRILGDPAQDEIMLNRLFDLENREVEYYDWYDNMPESLAIKHGNGTKGRATLTIADDGSGDAESRENIELGLALNGIPVRGNVKVTPPTAEGENSKIVFIPLAGAAQDAKRNA